MEACTEDKFLPVLPLVLEGIADVQVLCRLLQVSSTVRRTLQQARGSGFVTNLPGDSAAQSTLCTAQGFGCFCSWLQQHSGLIGSLVLRHYQGQTAEAYQAMTQMLQTALQASTAAHVPGKAAPPRLQLQAYISTCIGISSALLSALARAQPYLVCLGVQPAQLTAAARGAFGTLQSVKILSASWPALDDEQQNVGEASRRFQHLCAGIGQLTKLIQLNLPVDVPAPSLQLLPASLQQLSFDMQEAAAGARLDLTHLTALTKLSVQDEGLGDAVTAVQLPAGVSCLDVSNGSVRLLGPHMPLHVKLAGVLSTSDLLILRDLSAQQQPWSLELRAPWHTEFDSAAGAALSACASLTALVLHDGLEEEDPDSLPWSRHVAALTRLRHLEHKTCEYEQQDLMQLTALTALSHLSMSCDVNDTVAVALALNLTGLCHLELSCGELRTAGVLPVAAKLSGLRHLQLMPRCVEDGSCSEFSKAITPAVLSQLLPLTQLSYLGLPLGAACPSEARQQFLDSMPGLSCLHVAP